MEGGILARLTGPRRSRSEQSLEKYLQEIAEVPLLKPEEEIELAKRIKQGDEEALEKLTKANLRFVVSVAKQYQNQGLSLGVVRLPLNRVGALNKIGRVLSELEQEFEREPSEEEIAEQLEMTPYEVSDTLQMAGKHVSLDAPFNQDEESRLLDVLENEDMPSPDRPLIDESLKIELERALSTLTKREAEVIKLYFGLGREHPLTLEEIGELFNLSVRQIKEKAIMRLRHASRSKALRPFLGEDS